MARPLKQPEQRKPRQRPQTVSKQIKGQREEAPWDPQHRFSRLKTSPPGSRPPPLLVYLSSSLQKLHLRPLPRVPITLIYLPPSETAPQKSSHSPRHSQLQTESPALTLFSAPLSPRAKRPNGSTRGVTSLGPSNQWPSASAASSSALHLLHFDDIILSNLPLLSSPPPLFYSTISFPLLLPALNYHVELLKSLQLSTFRIPPLLRLRHFPVIR